ncbi:MAG: hypothetical protein K2N12_04255 [Helicobacter sp.]|nr:hypothetical protein [Helicobacter sp.]
MSKKGWIQWATFFIYYIAKVLTFAIPIGDLLKNPLSVILKPLATEESRATRISKMSRFAQEDNGGAIESR